jgi:peptide/nickel transport system ATP-binding protein
MYLGWIEGEAPSPVDPPTGCPFRTRCPKFAALDEGLRRRCIDEKPALRAVGDDQEAACHYAERMQVV